MLVFPSVGVLDIVRSSFAAPRWAHAPSICIELTPSGGMLHPTFPSCTPIVRHRMFACLHALLPSAPSSYDPACALRVLLFIAHSPFAAPCWAHLPSPCSRRESPHHMLPFGLFIRIALHRRYAHQAHCRTAGALCVLPSHLPFVPHFMLASLPYTTPLLVLSYPARGTCLQGWRLHPSGHAGRWGRTIRKGTAALRVCGEIRRPRGL